MRIDKLLDEPSSFDFYQAVHTIQKKLIQKGSHHHKVGNDSLPRNELIRFKSAQNLGFSGESIEKIEKRIDEETDSEFYDFYISFMGLTGPSGVLPQHYSELVLQRIKHKDTGMRDFFDLFNHRLISLFYRAWEKYRFSVNYLNSDMDQFSQTLHHLIGGNSQEQLYFSGFYNQKVRNAEGLTSILRELTGCEVMINQLVGKWQKLSHSEQTRLASRMEPEGQYARLGHDASCGSKVWDINSSIEIILKPQSTDSIEDLMPKGKYLALVKQTIRSYLGSAIEFSLRLETQLGKIPNAQLSQAAPPLGAGVVLVARECQLNKSRALTLAR